MLYATRADMKARIGLDPSQTAKDALLDAILDGTSRAVERHCHRWFYPRIQTRVFTPVPSDGLTPVYASHLSVDDLLSVTALATDQDGDLVYETVWATTDYALYPPNATKEEIPEPFWGVRVLPYGHYRFPAYPDSTQIAGTWGYYNVTRTATETLGSSINASVTTLPLSSATDVQIGHTLTLDSEMMYVTGLVGANATVQRGQNGTTAAAHTSGAAILIQTYPGVHDAVLFQAQLDFVASEGSSQTAAGGAFSSPIPGAGGLHSYAQRMLETFCRDAVG